MARQKEASPVAVEPIIKKKDIKAISELTFSNPRNHLLWTMGINNGIRAGDLVRTRVGQVNDLKVGGQFKIVEEKTGKDNIVLINKSVYKSLRRYLDKYQPPDNDYLFPSRKGKGHITSKSVGRLIRQWADQINLKGNYGAHTMRKTWAFCSRKTFGVSWSIICKRLNHSSPAITMRYLGIQPEEVETALMNEIG